MPKNVKQKGGKGKREDLGYAHNPRYCMILPDAAAPDEEVASSSES